MSALFRIVYAAHANGTHHKLALDALNALTLSEREAWQRLFLKHAATYLEGSKAPDTSFKDFKNHVLHVADNYWGGAPEKVEAWYGHTVTALREERWQDAVYAAGVLSHYYTDPVHPFHTGQTEAENAIHRACEWSINRSYDALKALGDEKFANLTVATPEGAHWLREAVCDGAEFSHRYYEKLIAHYDFTRGVVRPEEGLDATGRTVCAELITYAAKGFGGILDRALSESGVSPPPVALTIETVLATLKTPRKWIEKKLTNAEDKRLVQAMYDELQATGRVEQNLPEDDRMIRDLHAREVLAPKQAALSAARAKRVPAGEPGAIARQEQMSAAKSRPVAPAVLAGDTALAKAVANSARTVTKAATPPALPKTAPPSPISVPVDMTSRAGIRERTRYLDERDPLEAAPSIGPKMAEKFAALGIISVADFLSQDPGEIAELLDDSRVDAETVTDWQDQAKLMIEVPGLKGTHAQLLVGAGYRTAAAIADGPAVELSAAVLKFATSTEGRRVLRDGTPPDIERIKDWLAAANEALAA